VVKSKKRNFQKERGGRSTGEKRKKRDVGKEVGKDEGKDEGKDVGQDVENKENLKKVGVKISG